MVAITKYETREGCGDLGLPLSFAFGVLNSSCLSATAHYEKLSGRRLMPLYLASFSVGGLTGSVLGGVLIENIADQGDALLLAVAITLFAGILLCLLDVRASPIVASSSTRGFPTRLALILGCLAALNIGTTGIIVDWSALWLTRDLGVSAAYGGAIVFAYYAGEITGRVFGEKLVRRFGERMVGTYFVLVGCATLGVVLHSDNVLCLVIGFFPFGLLGANIVPIIMGLGSSIDERYAQKNVGDINLISFVGLAIGPSVVGILADTYSIDFVMHVLAIAWAGGSLAMLPLTARAGA